MILSTTTEVIMDATFAEMMEKERERLNGKLEELAKKKYDLDQEAGAINMELAAMTAYFDTKMGKLTQRIERNTKTRTPRGPRTTGLPTKLAELVNSRTVITKQEILSVMGAKGNKAEEGKIGNALTKLTKAGTITNPERGVYKPVGAQSQEPPPETPKPKRVKKEEATS